MCARSWLRARRLHSSTYFSPVTDPYVSAHYDTHSDEFESLHRPDQRSDQRAAAVAKGRAFFQRRNKEPAWWVDELAAEGWTPEASSIPV